MSNDKEFDKWFYVGEKCNTRFDNVDKNDYYKCLDAWNHQQEIIDAKDEEIRLLDQYKKVAESYYPFNKYMQKKCETNYIGKYIGRNYGDIAVEMLKSKDNEIELLKKELALFDPILDRIVAKLDKALSEVENE